MSEDSPKLGSLTTSARNKKLNQARASLIIAGILSIIMGVIPMIDTRNQIKKEVRKQNPFAIIPEAELTRVVRLVQTIAAAYIVLGVIFIVFACIVHKYPVPITITGLVLYVGSLLVLVAISGDPAILFKGILWKIIILVGLIQGISTAVALEKERREEHQRRYDDEERLGYDQ